MWLLASMWLCGRVHACSVNQFMQCGSAMQSSVPATGKLPAAALLLRCMCVVQGLGQHAAPWPAAVRTAVCRFVFMFVFMQRRRLLSHSHRPIRTRACVCIWRGDVQAGLGPLWSMCVYMHLQAEPYSGAYVQAGLAWGCQALKR